MQICFALGPDTTFECMIKLRDAFGERTLMLSPYGGEENPTNLPREVFAEVSGGDFDIELLPQFPPYREQLMREPTDGAFEKMMVKGFSKLLSASEKMFLRVGGVYHVTGAYDGCTIGIDERMYLFGSFITHELLELLPVGYCFFELSVLDTALVPLDAFGLNRAEFLSFVRKFSMLNLGCGMLITYPWQVCRARCLTRNRKVRKTLQKIYSLPTERRQAIFGKMDSKF